MEYEQLPVEPDKVYYYEKRYEKRPSSVVSWLGFCFALFTLLLLWLTMFATSVSHDTEAGGMLLAMLVVLLYCPLGLVGLILSIVGLAKASNNGTPIWIGACGVIFSALSILSVVLPMLVAISI